MDAHHWALAGGRAPGADHRRPPPVTSQLALATIGGKVAGGQRFDHDSELLIGGIPIEFGWVHPRHFHLDTLGIWAAVHEHRHRGTSPQALQVFLPEVPGDDPIRRWPLTAPHGIG